MTEILNPFKVKQGDIIEAFKKEKGGLYEYAEVISGEVSLFQKVEKSKRVIVDKANYIKLFRSGSEVIRQLSPNGLKLFMYIVFHMGIHKDNVYLEPASVSEWCGCKRSSFYRALAELVEKNIVSKKTGSSIEYFVNPNFIFNGSRLKL